MMAKIAALVAMVVGKVPIVAGLINSLVSLARYRASKPAAVAKTARLHLAPKRHPIVSISFLSIRPRQQF
jgi:hypothetical protein